MSWLTSLFSSSASKAAAAKEAAAAAAAKEAADVAARAAVTSSTSSWLTWTFTGAAVFGAYTFLKKAGFPTGHKRRQPPAGSSFSFVHLSRGRVRYQWTGSEAAAASGEKKVIVLVHGFSTPFEIWSPVAERLAAKGYRVLQYDLYGRGWSDAPDCRQDEGFFLSQLAELLIALRIPTPINLCGVSMGGALVMLFANIYPQLVDHLVVCCPAGFPTLRPLVSRIPELLPIVLGDALAATLGPLALKANMDRQFEKPSDPAAGNVKDMVKTWSTEQPAAFRSLLSTLRYFPLEDISDSITTLAARYTKPTLLLWGTDDRMCPYSNKDKCEKCFSQVKTVTLDKAGHAFIAERPDETAKAILEFLSKAS